MKKNVASVSREAVEPALVSAGFTVWDVRYEKEANVWTLVFELDRGENMSMSDCEEANAIIEPIIDGLDPIEGAYVLEVSSAGLKILLASQKTMNMQGTMIIKNANAAIREIFDVTGFSDIMTLE